MEERLYTAAEVAEIIKESGNAACAFVRGLGVATNSFVDGFVRGAEHSASLAMVKVGIFEPANFRKTTE